MKKTKKKKNRISNVVITAVVIFSVLFFVYTMKTAFFPPQEKNNVKSEQKLTTYDIELAGKFMDKDGDGMCDACGMPVDMCIESGQLQCNMVSSSTIGILGSQHIHADWKIYIEGKPQDLSDKSHMARMIMNLPVSSFIHVDSGAPAPEKTGDILHMHATGIPLWIFFDSIELELPESTKVYVNGELNSDGLNYVFNDLDKILISYGNDSEEDIQQQLNSITNFASLH